MSNLTILNTSVRQLDNLYSLTDLHRVSGGETKHKPTFFLRNEQTKELMTEIEQESKLQNCNSVKIIHGGVNSGTYACEELALAYAMWISPKFHLVVLRAFIAMHKGENLQNPQPNLPLAEVQADEEALQIIVNLYHSLREAHEFAVLAHDVDHRWLKQSIDKDLGGHLLHNLNHPAKNALDKAKKYIHAKSERIMFVKGMLSLLEAPKPKRIANF